VPRERQITQLIARGLGTAGIAAVDDGALQAGLR
jgi:hypothetical protein